MLDTFKHATPEAMEAIKTEMTIRHTSEVFLLFAMGSQFDHLIFQALSKLGVFCLVADPASVTADDVATLSPTGIIVSGGPASVQTEPPPFDGRIFDLGIPVLGICLGFQMWARHIGIRVSGGSEFGAHSMKVTSANDLFDGCGEIMQVLQSHGERVELDGRLTVLGVTNGILSAASYHHLWGVQFHPEVTDTPRGQSVFENFCFKICWAKDRFPAHSIAQQKIEELQKQIGEKRLLLALSGGSDSSVVAYLLKEALQGKHRLRGVYIKGIDRPDDEIFVRKYFEGQPWLELVVIDAADRFLEVLTGKITMREKRLAMRGAYKQTLEEQVAKFGAGYIAQGTLYTDISESGGGHASGARKAVIKIHHNTNLGFSVPELTPLSDCVKDGGRNIGREIGVPEELLIRHPFPGSGQVVRIEGEVTKERLAMVRHADGIYIEELRHANLYHGIWQAGAVVTASIHTVSKGDDAGSGSVIALWAVYSVNGFTAKAGDLPLEFRQKVARRIGNEVPGVGAVVYRISDKPFSTIEWG